MAERTFIPSSPACGQWETLLAEALDGLLKPEDEATFTAHMAVCPACTALFEEARRGREWLEFLSPEPEVPAGLLAKILAQTGPGHEAGLRLATAGGHDLPMRPVTVPAWQRPGFLARVQRFAEPRLLMTAAMAFFSIAMTLNLTGVKLSSLHFSDLRLSSMRSFMERRLTMASTPIIRYYDNSRLAYEVQTRMRELRRTTQGVGEGQGEENQQTPQNSAPGESKQAPGHKDGSQRTDPLPQPESLAAGPADQPTLNNSDFLETSQTFQKRSTTPETKTYRWGPGSAHSGGSRGDRWERSTKWIA